MSIIKSNNPSSFLGLTDSPSSYVGNSEKLVRVKTAEDGVEFYSASNLDTSNNTIPNVTCLASVYEGAFVYMDGSGVANNALADDLATSNVIGVVDAKLDATTCIIRFLGLSNPIFAALDPTKEYYLSDTVPGGIQTNIPTASGHVRLKIGQPFSTTRMLILKGEALVRL